MERENQKKEKKYEAVYNRLVILDKLKKEINQIKKNNYLLFTNRNKITDNIHNLKVKSLKYVPNTDNQHV